MDHDIAWPGSVRPGGRTARVRESVLEVAGDLLADRGFAHLDLTEVATGAGVGKTTVYRRWRTLPAWSPTCSSRWQSSRCLAPIPAHCSTI